MNRKIILTLKYFNEFPTEILVLPSLVLKKGVKTFSLYVMSFSLCRPITSTNVTVLISFYITHCLARKMF